MWTIIQWLEEHKTHISGWMNCHEVNNHITNYPTIYHHQGQAMPSHLLFLAFTFRTGIHLKLINILCEVRVRIIFSPFDWSTSFIDKSLSLLTYHGAFAINQEPYMWGQYFLSPILFFLIITKYYCILADKRKVNENLYMVICMTWIFSVLKSYLKFIYAYLITKENGEGQIINNRDRKHL